MPRGYYKRNQRNKTKTEPAPVSGKGLIEEIEQALITQDRNKMTLSELRHLVATIEERTKRDR